MSKPMTRVAISVLICLAILAGVYTVVLAKPVQKILNSGATASHLVSGEMVNLDHYRLTRVDQALYQQQLDSYYGQADQGHNCNSSQQNSPDD